MACTSVAVARIETEPCRVQWLRSALAAYCTVACTRTRGKDGAISRKGTSKWSRFPQVQGVKLLRPTSYCTVAGSTLPAFGTLLVARLRQDGGYCKVGAIRPGQGRGHAYCALVIAIPVIIAPFRKECSAADSHPRQSCWRSDRLRPSRLWLPRSVIAPASSSDPDGCWNFYVR